MKTSRTCRGDNWEFAIGVIFVIMQIEHRQSHNSFLKLPNK